jgi:hypothetical protein
MAKRCAMVISRIKIGLLTVGLITIINAKAGGDEVEIVEEQPNTEIELIEVPEEQPAPEKSWFQKMFEPTEDDEKFVQAMVDADEMIDQQVNTVLTFFGFRKAMDAKGKSKALTNDNQIAKSLPDDSSSNSSDEESTESPAASPKRTEINR